MSAAPLPGSAAPLAASSCLPASAAPLPTIPPDRSALPDATSAAAPTLELEVEVPVLVSGVEVEAMSGSAPSSGQRTASHVRVIGENSSTMTSAQARTFMPKF
jgi:hypothetical protein